MDTSILIKEIQTLPPALKEEVKDFVGYLKSKKSNIAQERKPVLGSGKGTFVIKDGFDDPLEDFAEYM
jgi:hypothetical protein